MPAVVGIITAMSCVGTASQRSTRSNVVYEVPDGFRGWVIVEYSSPSCHAPIDRQGRSVIPISETGTGCSSHSVAQGWSSSAVEYRQSGRSIAKGAGGDPGQAATLPKGQDPQTVFVWWGIGWTCEESGLAVQSFFIGTTDECNKDRDGWQKLKCGAKPTA